MLIRERILKLLKIFLIILSLGSFLVWLPEKTDAAVLLGSTDYIEDDTINEVNIVHNVGFLTPFAGHTIVASDYIRIVFTNYTSVTAPTSISGVGGSPIFGVVGNVAYVTNVTAGPNTGIGISGITATNPANPTDFDINIEIADDISGTTVYDSAVVAPTVYKGTSTVTVNILAVSSSLDISGFTSPNAFVTFLLDSAVAGTAVANGSGDFNKVFTGLLDGDHVVDIYAEDTLLRQTQTIQFNVTLLPNATTTVNNIPLPTTIELSPTTIFERGSLTISGLSHPLSQLAMFIQGTGLYSGVAVANSLGQWSYVFDSRFNPVNIGSNYSYGKETATGGYVSEFTQNEYFTVNSCIKADVNCDGYVNLTDFSIMLFYWLQSYPANFRADINDDFVVNLTDFSIMLYYWTG